MNKEITNQIQTGQENSSKVKKKSHYKQFVVQCYFSLGSMPIINKTGIGGICLKS